MKIIYEDSNMKKPESCCECPWARWERMWVTCLIRLETKEDKGKDYCFKCPILESK